MTWAGRPRASEVEKLRFGQHAYVRHLQRIELLYGVRASGRRGHIVVADQQQGGDAGSGEAHDAPPPFALEGGRRGAVFVGITRKDHQVHFFVDGSIHDGVQGFEEVEHAQRQSRVRVVPSVVGHVDVGVGEVEEFHVFIVGRVDNPLNGLLIAESPTTGRTTDVNVMRLLNYATITLPHQQTNKLTN